MNPDLQQTVDDIWAVKDKFGRPPSEAVHIYEVWWGKYLTEQYGSKDDEQDEDGEPEEPTDDALSGANLDQRWWWNR